MRSDRQHQRDELDELVHCQSTGQLTSEGGDMMDALAIWFGMTSGEAKALAQCERLARWQDSPPPNPGEWSDPRRIGRYGRKPLSLYSLHTGRR